MPRSFCISYKGYSGLFRERTVAAEDGFDGADF